MFSFPCCQPSSTQVREPFINLESEPSDAMLEDVDDINAMDLCRGEQKSSIIDDLVLPPFEQIDPRGPKCRNMGSPALKALLLQANERIALVEGCCARASEEISKLQLDQYNTSQNLSCACDQINVLQCELDENIVTATENARLLDDYKNDRVVPTDIMQESLELGEESSIVQQALSTIIEKNAQIFALRQELASLTSPSSSSSTASTSSTVLVKNCSESLARLGTFMKKKDYTMDTQKMMEYSSQKYISELASEGGDQFLVFLMTVLDNADRLSRKESSTPARDEVEKIYALTRAEVNIMAIVCEYLVGPSYSWEFSFLFCIVELAGKRSSDTQRRNSGALIGAPSPNMLASYMKQLVDQRRVELFSNPIPIFGEILSLHDNAAAKGGYFLKSSRQREVNLKGRVCALVLAVDIIDNNKPFQFLQSQSENSPGYALRDLPTAPPLLLELGHQEIDYLKMSFLDRITEQLDIMKSNNYQIGAGRRENNQKPEIKIPDESTEQKKQVQRICPNCGYSYNWEYTKRTCERTLLEAGVPYMCGHNLPKKAEALLNYILDEDASNNEEDHALRVRYQTDVDYATDIGSSHREKIQKKIVAAARIIVNEGDPRIYTHHQSGYRQEGDFYSDGVEPSEKVHDSSYSSQSAQSVQIEMLQEEIYRQQQQKQSGLSTDDGLLNRSSSERRSEGIMRTSRSTRHYEKDNNGQYNISILPQGVVHGNPGRSEVMEELRLKRLKDAKVDGYVDEGATSYRRWIAVCQDMGTTLSKFYQSKNELFLMPWLHALMNLNKKCLDLIKFYDNKDYSPVAALYCYVSRLAQKCFFGNADNHKGQDATCRYFLVAAVRHITHTGVDLLGSREFPLPLEEMTAEMIYDVVKAQTGATCQNFLALIEHVLHPFDLLCQATRKGPSFQRERIACQKCWLPLSIILGQKDYFPALTWDVILREYLYSETRNPAMHEWMKNVALLKTDDKDVWLAIDEIIEHWVRKWKACAPSSSKNSHDFGEALAADIDDLKEKLNFLLRQLTPKKQERPWTNLEHFIQKLTTFFDHHGTCRGDGNEAELKSFDGSEMLDISKGILNLISEGKKLRDVSYTNLRETEDFLPVSPSSLGERDADLDDEMVEELAVAVSMA